MIEKKKEIVRGLMHSFTSIVIIYYMIPNKIFEIHKELYVLFFLVLVLLIEIVRIIKNVNIFGLIREYEHCRFASYVWCAMGIAISLLLFQKEFVIPVIVGWAFVDPLIRYFRKLKNKWLYPLIPSVVYALLFFTCLTFFVSDFLYISLFVSIATTTAIISEYPKLCVDDDFLMIICPLAALKLLTVILNY